MQEDAGLQGHHVQQGTVQPQAQNDGQSHDWQNLWQIERQSEVSKIFMCKWKICIWEYWWKCQGDGHHVDASHHAWGLYHHSKYNGGEEEEKEHDECVEPAMHSTVHVQWVLIIRRW